MKDCNECGHMYPNESEQTFKGEQHMCALAHREVKHEGSHPKLPAPVWCPAVEIPEGYLDGAAKIYWDMCDSHMSAMCGGQVHMLIRERLDDLLRGILDKAEEDHGVSRRDVLDAITKYRGI